MSDRPHAGGPEGGHLDSAKIYRRSQSLSTQSAMLHSHVSTVA